MNLTESSERRARSETPTPDAFGRVVVERGYASSEDVDRHVALQRELLEEGENKRLGTILVEEGVITPDQFVEVLGLQEAIRSRLREAPFPLRLLVERDLLPVIEVPGIVQEWERSSGTIGEVLVHGKYVDEVDLARLYAEHYCLPYLDAKGLRPYLESHPEVASEVPEMVCRDHLCIAFHREDGVVEVAMADPGATEAIDEIQIATGLLVSPHAAPLTVIERLLAASLGQRDLVREISSGEEDAPEADEGPDGEEEGHLDLARPAPAGKDGHVIKLVNHVFSEALRLRASDIHIEPFEHDMQIRFRVDGALKEITPPPKSMYVPMVSRIKVLSRMDIAERRTPQDGAFALRLGEQSIDLRVSTVPTVHGEKVVIRLLNKDAAPMNLEGLGFDERQVEDFEAAIVLPNGLVFVTGPTGSGKTTTLYAGLRILNRPDVNIVTVEDPVEYKFRGVNQIQVKAQVDMTFASALRAFLRQDPDIIMVGEVRDQETAEICLRAALTGHLVLSTLHTNDALGAVSRLVDMGIEPFLLGSTLRLLQAQRLVRRLCRTCRIPAETEASVLEKYGLEPSDPLFSPQGCPGCMDSGYQGRVGIYEVIRIVPELADAIQASASGSTLQEIAARAGMSTLFQSGIEKVRQGLTTLEEILAASRGQ